VSGAAGVLAAAGDVLLAGPEAIEDALEGVAKGGSSQGPPHAPQGGPYSPYNHLEARQQFQEFPSAAHAPKKIDPVAGAAGVLAAAGDVLLAGPEAIEGALKDTSKGSAAPAPAFAAPPRGPFAPARPPVSPGLVGRQYYPAPAPALKAGPVGAAADVLATAGEVLLAGPEAIEDALKGVAKGSASSQGPYYAPAPKQGPYYSD
jgi:hypothetical protein